MGISFERRSDNWSVGDFLTCSLLVYTALKQGPRIIGAAVAREGYHKRQSETAEFGTRYLPITYLGLFAGNAGTV